MKKKIYIYKVFEDIENKSEKQTSRKLWSDFWQEKKKEKLSGSLFGKYLLINPESKVNDTDKINDVTIWNLLLNSYNTFQYSKYL